MKYGTLYRMNRRVLLQMTLGSACAVGAPGCVSAGERRPIRTGIEAFDTLHKGLPLGSLSVIHGDMKAGKTTLAMNIAEHVAVEEKRPVLYLVQSFSAQTLFGQIASSRAGVDWLDVAEGKLREGEGDRFEVASREIASAPLTIDDMPALEDEEITERIGAWAEKNPAGLAIVDHIRRETAKAVDRCSQAMKAVAVRTGTAVFATSWDAPLWDDTRMIDGVGTSHADFAWRLFRWWCVDNRQYSREDAYLSICDERTGENRVRMHCRLDEKARRLGFIGREPTVSSLREERLRHPSGTVYHRILKPGEEPPAGARVVYFSGVDETAEGISWDSSSWEA